MSGSRKISVSIVSHQQGPLVEALLADLGRCCASIREVILTVNVNEDFSFAEASFGFPVEIITNPVPKGFGANHNAAFGIAKAEYFCVLNPDIRLEHDPFPCLIEQLSDPSVGVAAPVVLSPAGQIEDSARRFPTPVSILRKAFFGDPGSDYLIEAGTIYPEWVAGMFMLFRSPVFRSVGGFDERYYLYYEDVDLCWRLQCKGYRAALTPSASVIHEARRESRRSVKYLGWHLSSMLRFFTKRGLQLAF